MKVPNCPVLKIQQIPNVNILVLLPGSVIILFLFFFSSNCGFGEISVHHF